jgi:hypothetical protein
MFLTENGKRSGHLELKVLQEVERKRTGIMKLPPKQVMDTYRNILSICHH